MAEQRPPETPPQEPLPMPPALPPEMPPPPPQQRRGPSGCVWLTAGGLGCLLLIAAPIIGLLLVGTISVNGLIGGIQSIFNAPVNVTAQTVLDSIQDMSQLTTVRYNYSSIITSERDMPDVLKLLYGERQVMVAVGHVNAGIDLGQITAEDVMQDGDTLTIVLPPPQLQDCFLSEQESYIASMDTGLFARSAPELVVSGRQFAVQHFRERSLTEGILDAVQTQTQAVITELVNALNPEAQVQVLTTPPDPAATPPPTCQ